MSLRHWPGLLVAAVAAAWPLLVVAYLWWRLSRLMRQAPGEAAAVSGSLVEFVVILLGPPALLVAAWVFLRWAGR
jgi:hypothetical protein